MRFLVFVLVIVAAFAAIMAAPAEEKTCSARFGPCQRYEDCCRNLLCPSYVGHCVPRSGLLDPNDKRPIGPDPYPPTNEN